MKTTSLTMLFVAVLVAVFMGFVFWWKNEPKRVFMGHWLSSDNRGVEVGVEMFASPDTGNGGRDIVADNKTVACSTFTGTEWEGKHLPYYFDCGHLHIVKPDGHHIIWTKVRGQGAIGPSGENPCH